MYEDVDRTHGCTRRGHRPSARTSYVRPVRPRSLIHQYLRLFVPTGHHWWQIDAPETTVSVVGFSYRAKCQHARHTSCNPGLEHLLRIHVTNGAPDDMRQVRIGIMPFADLETRRPHVSLKIAPDFVEALLQGTRPVNSEELVKTPYGFRRRRRGFLACDGRKSLTEDDLRSATDPVHSLHRMRGEDEGRSSNITRPFPQIAAGRHPLTRHRALILINSHRSPILGTRHRAEHRRYLNSSASRLRRRARNPLRPTPLGPSISRIGVSRAGAASGATWPQPGPGCCPTAHRGPSA